MASFGRPDAEGKCNAWYVHGGEYGDEESHVFRCELPPGHPGLHKEMWTKGSNGNDAFLAWAKDERPEIERQEEYDNGGMDGCRPQESAIPEEPGEAYLEGFCEGVLDYEAYRARADEQRYPGDTVVLSRAELEARADREAHDILGVGREEAFAMLDRGGLEGTIIQAELSMLRSLIEGKEP